MDISIIVPLLNERESLPELVSRIDGVMTTDSTDSYVTIDCIIGIVEVFGHQCIDIVRKCRCSVNPVVSFHEHTCFHN